MNFAAFSCNHKWNRSGQQQLVLEWRHWPWRQLVRWVDCFQCWCWSSLADMSTVTVRVTSQHIRHFHQWRHGRHLAREQHSSDDPATKRRNNVIKTTMAKNNAIPNNSTIYIWDLCLKEEENQVNCINPGLGEEDGYLASPWIRTFTCIHLQSIIQCNVKNSHIWSS